MLESRLYVQTFQIVSAAISRAVTACRPTGLILVTVKLVGPEQRVHISVADTGRAVSGAQEVASSFHAMCSRGCFNTLINMHIRTTALDESSCREFTATATYFEWPPSVVPPSLGPGSPSSSPGPLPEVKELPCSPKSCPNGPFSGSEVSFDVRAEPSHWLSVLDAVQAVLETTLMVAPFPSIDLRIQGFDEHNQVMGLEPVPKKVKYDLGPLLGSLTPSERLEEGLRAYFLGDAAPDQPADHLSNSQSAQEDHKPGIYVGSDQSSAAPKPRSAKWTACAGLITSGDPLDLVMLDVTMKEHPGVRLLLFENYGLMQRPQDSILKALERVDWVQYNLPLEGIVEHADGSAMLRFTPTVDQICKDIRLLIVHLVSTDVGFKMPKKGLMPPGLSQQLQAKLVKSAVENVLLRLKQSRPLAMQSPFEQRMACLSHISRSIAGIVSSSENAEFQKQALQLANSSMDELPIKIQARLESIALDVLAAAANSSRVAGQEV